MKKCIVILSTAVFVVLLLAGTNLLIADNDDIMHPEFSLLDKDGNVITDAKGTISGEKTCGKCHDTKFINRHNIHYNDKVKADCMVCHFKEEKEGDDYTQAHLRVQLPSDQNCAFCHGVVHTGSNSMEIPSDYLENISYVKDKKFYNLTQNTGTVLSHQNLSGSSLNIKDKQEQNFAWDIHSRRQLNCISCHFIKNDPRYCGTIRSSLDHLIKDPRKIKPPHQYLKRPNHDLNNATCSCCHNPLLIHKDMPYRERHMEVLSCQACHVPELFGPAFQSVDETVVTLERTARIEIRSVDENKSHGLSLNTKYYKGYLPFLLPHKTIDGKYGISPFNFVTRWIWKSEKSNKPVPPEVLWGIYLNDSGTDYTADVLKLFDADQNKVIDTGELVLDSEEKINFIKEKLEGSGIEEPVITGTVNAYKINHGVVNVKQMNWECSACHAEDSKFGRDVILAVNSPKGITPELSSDILPIIDGEIIENSAGEIIIKRTSSVTGHYVFGHGRVDWLNHAGFWMFILSLLFVVVHGGFRYIFSLKNPVHQTRTKRVYMYGSYERIWHWTMASGVIILALTGLEIHYTGSFHLFGLETAVPIHNVLAIILTINAILSLFFHLATGEISQFLKFNMKFIHETLLQAVYYIYGIFRREPHPINKSVERKLNPLQQLTYIGLLNILLPFQIITGILIMGTSWWPDLSAKLGGLTYLAPIHNFGSWLLLAFMVIHVYLTTTGHTVFSNLKAMITGYDEVEEGKPSEEQLALMSMKLMDLTGTLIGKFVKKKVITEDDNDRK